MVSGAMDINTDLNCSRAMDPDVALVGAQAQTSPYLQLLDLPLSTEHEPYYLPLPYPTIYLLTIVVPNCPGAGSCFLLVAWGGLLWACMWVSFSHLVLMANLLANLF